MYFQRQLLGWKKQICFEKLFQAVNSTTDVYTISHNTFLALLAILSKQRKQFLMKTETLFSWR